MGAQQSNRKGRSLHALTVRVSTTLPLRTAVLLGLIAWGVLGWDTPAWAHGGRVIPPVPNFRPGGGAPPPPKTTPPPAPGTPPGAPPTTPPSTGPRPRGPTPPPPPPPSLGGPTTGGLSNPSPSAPSGGRARGRTSSGAGKWQMWWALNRWAYFPDRASLDLAGRPITVTDRSSDPLLRPDQILAAKRNLVRRELILPFLVEHLDPNKLTDAGKPQRPEIVASAAIALGRACHDPASIDLILRVAERKGAANVERESAALAVGLTRRADPKLRFAGDVLDRARVRLLKLFGDQDVPDRTRAFAVFAIGMLADQPYGSTLGRNGTMVTRALWQRLQDKQLDREDTVALLTALGMQPASGIPQALVEDMRRIVLGRHVYRRGWSADERSHALTALGRWAVPSCFTTLLRVCTDRRLAAPIRRAGFAALGRGAKDFTSEQRVESAQAVERGLRSCADSLTKGLGQLALGRLLGADLRAGSPAVLLRTDAASFLLGQARNAPSELHGFSVLALALSARALEGDDSRTAAHAGKSTALLLEEFRRADRNSVRREPLIVALGLVEAVEAQDELIALLADRRAPPALRGHSAISIGMIGRPERSTLVELRRVLLSKRSPELSSQSALALSFLSGARETPALIEAMNDNPSQWVLAQLAAAVGHLGDIHAVDAMLTIARDNKRMEETRALAVTSLGLLGDPSKRPGLFRLTRDANYFAITDALSEVFTIL